MSKASVTRKIRSYSGEVEAVTYQQQAVREKRRSSECLMPRGGALVTAYLVLKPGKALNANELVPRCRQFLANHKVPRRIEFSEGELSKSGSGKILKRVLRDHFWAHQERGVS